ncbi:hypothetical protein CHLRE_12g553300v5 [Chlamydomonas reinhardtii]|uniref:Protein kinase domain-containing protein n=1 Tax=Chlamydomonas reinhardtii TaxID=3055 RepID=A0A2K3CT10_CHLRE|nr:uncharacterized protein CHLRE_16g654000v5 [Chlamydomonas reinhardtii]XP_042918954.1 uncharacterized protein CHLRE_12g553300v5 [Chlamydomonas reinhardtii]PNW71430.1 hypothetical protein CHLRE_16g654000v5 [Chlamydomonas reinhardtii]PNW75959.1 hypothetical protein CHLRE_12g553300v5 [Chlamydomonas reinhardtii]
MYEANKLATAKPGAKPGHSGYWKRSSKAYMQLGGWAAIHSTPQLSAYADSFYQPSMTTLVAALDALELQGPAGPATGSAVPSAAASSAAAAAAPTPLAAHLPGPSSSALTVPWVDLSYAAVRQQRERMDLQSVRRRAGGGFGDVYVMSLEDMSAGQGEVVVKLYRRVIEKSGDVAADRSALGNAIRWGLQCARPDVLPLRGLVRDVSGEAVGVIYEHFPSTLERWITAKDEKERPSKSLSQLCGVLRDAAVATEYLHSLGYIHRDIKPANILVSWRSC